ncbi:hypothetical protein Misp01_46660 [Microtetraspora sp. NBRC 13810]|nr:lasso RiPP family leader peptide-containing protein [Microtetraspora sp. NBRC 13810]GLW09537.1 hypothetical protein Misp01_46660 [Microtetraspora sp. NBRC 13810]
MELTAEQAVYAPPALTLVGGFADLTRGFPPGDLFDWPPQPFQFFNAQG